MLAQEVLVRDVLLFVALVYVSVALIERRAQLPQRRLRILVGEELLAEAPQCRLQRARCLNDATNRV